jgi:hypothetical protein
MDDAEYGRITSRAITHFCERAQPALDSWAEAHAHSWAKAQREAAESKDDGGDGVGHGHWKASCNLYPGNLFHLRGLLVVFADNGTLFFLSSHLYRLLYMMALQYADFQEFRGIFENQMQAFIEQEDCSTSEIQHVLKRAYNENTGQRS